MIKLTILAVKEQVFKQEGQEDRKYYTLTVLLADGDTAKVNSSKVAKAGQTAILSLQSDRKTGGLVVRCTDIA
ncbi:MAG: hypothetical protein J6K80_08095 [Oscillospiraceae bacterium]|nr:hypothetical protein [Oscillospiraceae bacterium]